jgi:hypothetical protein
VKKPEQEKKGGEKMPEQIPVLDLFSGIPPEGSASHSSLWPTPVGQDTNNLDPQEYLRRKKRKPNGAVTSLNVAVGMWPTPMSAINTHSEKAKHNRPTSGQSRGGCNVGLEDAVHDSAL